MLRHSDAFSTPTLLLHNCTDDNQNEKQLMRFIHVGVAAAAAAGLAWWLHTRRKAVKNDDFARMTKHGWAGRNKTKDALRSRVWSALKQSGDARDQDGPFNRIPDFVGAEAAAAHLQKLPLWQRARVVKSNPDPPQAFVRRNALRDGKRVYVPVPALTLGFPFLLLDPEALRAAGLTPEDVMYSEGAMAHGKRVEFSQMEPMDVCVVGSVAVTRAGGRTGKGGGFADLELGLFRHYGTCTPGVTPVVSTVHPLQLVGDEQLTMEEHDTPLDWVITPDGATPTHTRYPQPGKLDWTRLQPDQYESIPFLKTLRKELEVRT